MILTRYISDVMSIEQVLYGLLREAIGCDVPPIQLNDVDWMDVRDLAKRQGVPMIAGDGLSQWVSCERIVVEDAESSQSVTIDESLYLTWVGQTMVKEKIVWHHLAILKEFSRRCKEQGVLVYVLKGLAFALNYPIPQHRGCGDIDVFLIGDPNYNGSQVEDQRAYEIGNEVAEAMGAQVNTDWYKHSQIHFGEVMMENHAYLVCTREGDWAKSFNQYLIDILKQPGERCKLPQTEALVPPTQFNALFMMSHSLSHFVEEGINLRHVLDWATFLQKESRRLDWNQFYVDCEQYHLKRFVDVMSDIAVNVLGVEVSQPIVNTHSPYTEKVLHSILYDDAKVFGTEGSSWNHRLKIVKNIFRYGWKYSEIYEMSPMRYLWCLMKGFIMHTEK